MNKVTAYIAAGATVLVLFGSVIEVSESMPDNAFVYADTLSVEKSYYGMPTYKEEKALLESGKADAFKLLRFNNLQKMRVHAAREAGCKPNDYSRNNGDFVGETRSLIYAFFQRVGILPRQPRWNPDGTWNW